MLILLALTIFVGDGPFVEGNINEILKKAKNEDKKIFVDVFTTWCAPCKQMDAKTFSNAKVKEFLSTKMISIKIDAEKGEGVALAKKYGVMGYPSFLILDGDGKLIDREMGFLPPRALLNWVRTLL